MVDKVGDNPGREIFDSGIVTKMDKFHGIWKMIWIPSVFKMVAFHLSDQMKTQVFINF